MLVYQLPKGRFAHLSLKRGKERDRTSFRENISKYTQIDNGQCVLVHVQFCTGKDGERERERERQQKRQSEKRLSKMWRVLSIFELWIIMVYVHVNCICVFAYTSPALAYINPMCKWTPFPCHIFSSWGERPDRVEESINQKDIVHDIALLALGYM